MEYVYILDFGDRIKIGRSKRVNKRIRNIETQGGSLIKGKYIMECKHSLEIEKHLHDYYKEYRAVGEYFVGLDIEDIKKYITHNKSILLVMGPKFYNCKHSFTMLNSDIDLINKLESKVGPERMAKVLILYLSMGYYNDLDFSVLGLSEGGLKKFRSKLKKEGIIIKCKIDNKFGYKWYLNPLYGNKGKVYTELYETFNEINNNKIY